MLCKLTPEEEVRMHILLKGIADDPNALEMQKFIQHGSVTTYEHCLRVTRIAFWLNIHLHVRADEASLVKGAFLHDFTCTTGIIAVTSPIGTASSMLVLHATTPKPCLN